MVKAVDDHVAELHLEKQLERAVKKISAHSGSFAFGEVLPAAPNPGLEISSLGTIGLPLGVRDAEAIKNVAARSPFGHGDKLIIDSTVRDTWEIDGTQIKMRNAAWDSFMGDVVRMVRNGLGVAPSALPPKCELYKLLLYETGSHFLPHQDTEKAPGMFATIVIVLPSIYAGGEVRVVHGSEEKVLDFAGVSQLNTAVLAWYADVVHEVKPVTSGFRLALSYNLVQTGNVSVPLPPPGNTAMTHLRQVFSQWSEGVYDDLPGVICYKLEHRYSQSNLSKGISCLKGVDAYKVVQIKEAALSFDIEMGFGQFELRVVKEDPEEDGYYGYSSRYSKRRKYYCRYDDGEEDDDEENKEDEEWDDDDDDDEEGDDDDDETEIERYSKVSQLVDLEGTSIAPNATIDVNGIQAALIPKNAFKRENPDDEEREGYQGNAPGSIQQWYKRTVLILYLKRDEKRIMLQAGGVSYAITRLKKASPVKPNEDTKAYAEYVLGVKSYDDSNDILVLNLALSWGDLSLWQKAANKCKFNADPTSIGWERVVAAWDKFGFEALRPSLEGALQSLCSLKQQMHIIDFIKSRSKERSQDPIRDWCDQQNSRVLSSIRFPVKREDVPACLTVMKSKGSKFFAQSIMPQLVKLPDTYGFFLDLVNTLHFQRKELEDMSSPGVLQSVIHESLNAAVKQWKVTAPYYTSRTQMDGSRVKELAACLISTKEVAVLKRLFDSLTNDEADIRVKFRDLFVPLVPYLLRIQKDNDISIDTDVCGDFYRWLIEKHLRDVLGPKKSIPHASIRKIGCGITACRDCTELDEFMQSVEASHVFQYELRRRKHLESRLAAAPDLAVHRTIKRGSPHSLEVTKNKEIVEWSAWMERQKVAKSFLVSFGGDKALKDIMGDRFEDVVKALSGEKEYVIGRHVIQKPPKAPINHARSLSSGKDKAVKQTVSVASSGSAMATKPVAGVKRKGRPGADGPIIDLTTP